MSVKADTSDGTALAAGTNVPPAATRVFKRRWLILLLFSSYSMCNAFQWLQYGIINNIVLRFYNVDTFAIDWMSMMYMLTYIVFIFPSIWLLKTCGLRVMAIVATCVNCVGAWIKVGSARPALFWVTALGQFASALAQVFILGMPSAIASVWFGPDEVSTASSIGVAGNQVSNNSTTSKAHRSGTGGAPGKRPPSATTSAFIVNSTKDGDVHTHSKPFQ